MKIIIVFCTFLLFASTVSSNSMAHSPDEDVTSGNWLLVSCQLSARAMDDSTVEQTKFDSYRVGICNGLVEGVGDVSPRVCRDSSVTYGQQLRVVVKYLQDHPEELHLRNTALVEKALAKAFPCGK